jgi:hypothetical protein
MEFFAKASRDINYKHKAEADSDYDDRKILLSDRRGQETPLLRFRNIHLKNAPLLLITLLYNKAMRDKSAETFAQLTMIFNLFQCSHIEKIIVIQS